MSDPVDIHEDRDLEVARHIVGLPFSPNNIARDLEAAIWAALKQARREGRESVPQPAVVVLPLYRMAG